MQTTESNSKKIEHRLTFGEVMGMSLVSCFFLTHTVQYDTIMIRDAQESRGLGDVYKRQINHNAYFRLLPVF